MTKDIILKVREELDKGITTEVQVVYLMAAIRKLLERDGVKPAYANLWFYCNWALHSRLDQDAAQKIVQKFDDIVEAEANNDWALHQTLSAGIESLTDGNRLRTQLAAFFKQYGLPDSIGIDDGQWQALFKEYAAVVTDIPLEFNIPIKHVRKVILRRTDEVAEAVKALRPPFELGLGLEWELTKINGETSVPIKLNFLKP